jgi:uncharacterized protein YbjT (DUF2867 family)
MRVLLYGATGMVGQGVLRECLLDPKVTEVVSVGRSATGKTHRKLREVVRKDLSDSGGLEAELAGFDACFFCLGVSSIGMDEAAYSRITYDLTLAAARFLAPRNPGMTFVYVSGAGTDATEKGRSMWARVKGRTENGVLQLFPKGFAFRPGFIQPLDGIRSKTPLYEGVLTVLRPVLGGLRRLAPTSVTTTRQVGQAMLKVARDGWPTRVLEQKDIVAAARQG